MTTATKTVYKYLNVTASEGEKILSPFIGSGNNYVYKFNITLLNNQSGEKTKFNFFGSINDCNNGKNTIEGKDLLFAVYCFASDCLSYIQNPTFEDFINCFGVADIKTYNACRKQFEKSEKIGLCEQDLIDICNDEDLQ